MLTKESVEILMDLVEIKLSLLQPQDRDDLKEKKRMEHCREELMKMATKKSPTLNVVKD